MMLAKEFIIQDIINYETSNEINIRNELRHAETFVIIDMLAIGNSISNDEAIQMYNELRRIYSVNEIVVELAKEIFGNSSESNDNDVVENDKSYTEILYEFYNEIQTLDNKITISEFFNMNTTLMYKYADGIKQRYIFNKNKKYSDDFEYIAMFNKALSGKLRECPKICEDDIMSGKQRKEKRLNEMRARRGL